MNIFDIIKERRSIRRFKDKPIPDEVMEKLKEALIWAPSAGNLQDWHFYLVFKKEMKEKLALAAYKQMFIAEAPAVLIGCSNLNAIAPYGDKGIRIFTHHDLGASIQNFLLAAQAEGLGTCWIGAFNNNEVARLMDIPEHLVPLAIVPVGYPDESPSPAGRYNLESFFTIIK